MLLQANDVIQNRKNLMEIQNSWTWVKIAVALQDKPCLIFRVWRQMHWHLFAGFQLCKPTPATAWNALRTHVNLALKVISYLPFVHFTLHRSSTIQNGFNCKQRDDDGQQHESWCIAEPAASRRQRDRDSRCLAMLYVTKIRHQPNEHYDQQLSR